LHIAKNPKKKSEHVLKLRKKSKKYFCMFKNTKSIAWILQSVCKIPKDFGLYFKNIKNLFWVRNYIIHFEYKDKKTYKMVNIQNIIRGNNLLLFTFNIRIKKKHVWRLISKILLRIIQLIHL
jgi:hypothetical protein